MVGAMDRRTRSFSWRRGPLVATAGFLLALVSLVFWELSSPVASSPDDDFPLASIGCAPGKVPVSPNSPTLQMSGARQRRWSVSLLEKQTQGERGLPGDDWGQNPGVLRAYGQGSYVSSLPPVYYSVMSAFAGQDAQSSVFAMRIPNSALFLAMEAPLSSCFRRRLAQPSCGHSLANGSYLWAAGRMPAIIVIHSLFHD